jgi:uncharacterized protein (TIGR01777 family)
MRVLITGATGTIGGAVADRIRSRGDTLVATSRDPERARRTLGAEAEIHAWPDPTAAPPPADALRVDGIIHLIGEPIDQRWTDEARRRIRDSRVASTRQLVTGLESLTAAERPGVLVSQSAVGYYGDRGSEILEEDARAGAGWLAEVVVAWEAAAHRAPAGIRVITTRTGVVLSPSGGALAKMLPFFKLGIGGPVAGGGQYVPWIHLEDVVAGLLHCLEQPEAQGAANFTAPEPVTNKALARALGRVLNRPAFLPVPGSAVSMLYGEMAQLVTGGQRAVPAQLQQLGFVFTHPDLERALADVLQ